MILITVGAIVVMQNPVNIIIQIIIVVAVLRGTIMIGNMRLSIFMIVFARIVESS